MTAALKEQLRDERIWCIAARVVVPDGEEEHYEVTAEGHISIHVETLRHGVQLPALLKGGDDEGTGVWFIPSVGTEVIINFDDGEFEGDAYVVAIHGKGPAGLVPGKVFIRGDVVNICNANESALPTSGEGVVVGTGIDPFTGQTYNALGNASSKVFAKK